jgi:hypothetical protein
MVWQDEGLLGLIDATSIVAPANVPAARAPAPPGGDCANIVTTVRAAKTVISHLLPRSQQGRIYEMLIRKYSWFSCHYSQTAPSCENATAGRSRGQDNLPLLLKRSPMSSGIGGESMKSRFCDPCFQRMPHSIDPPDTATEARAQRVRPNEPILCIPAPARTASGSKALNFMERVLSTHVIVNHRLTTAWMNRLELTPCAPAPGQCGGSGPAPAHQWRRPNSARH